MANISIIGAGVYGLSIGLALLGAGHKVRMIEAGAVGQGASGGLVGALAPHVPEDWNVRKQYQLDALISAAEHWARVEALSGLPTGYGRVGRYIPLDDAYEAQKALSRVAGAARLWRDGFDWQVLQSAPGVDPAAAPFGVVHDTLSARVNPRLAGPALAGAVRALGGQIETGVRVDRAAAVSGDVVIIAAGVGSGALLVPFLGEGRIKGIKGQAALLAAELPAHMPVVNGKGVYIVPHANGTVAVGATSENRYAQPFAIDAGLDAVLDKARLMVPALRGAEVLERHAGLRPKAPKPEAMLGWLDDRTMVATGGFKTGFANAHRIGAEVVALVNGETGSFPGDFTPTHHLTKRKK